MLNNKTINNNISIKELINKLDVNNLNQCLSNFRSLVNYDIIFYEELTFLKDIWENKKVTNHNNFMNKNIKTGILNNFFCNLYFNKELNYYIFCYGNIGSSTLYKFNLREVN